MKRRALVLTLNLLLLFSAFSIFPVQAKQWITIQVPTPNLNPYGPTSITYDGDKIAFSASDAGLNENAKIFLVNWNGSGLKPLTSGLRMNMYPSISGDGNKIAFYSYVPVILGSGEPFVTDPQIYIVDTDGTGLRQLTWNTKLTPVRETPSISGDGNKIVFSASDESGRYDVFVLNSDGTGLMQLTNATSTNKSPSISSDGRKIAFISSSEDTSELFVINSDGTGLTSPLFTAESIGQPSISADGSKIAFSAYVNGYDQLFVINSDGTGLTSTQYTVNWPPSMSADGSRIAFSAGQLFLINSDGTETKLISSSSRFKPSISGDGSKIAHFDSWKLLVSVNMDGVLSDLDPGDGLIFPYNATRWSTPIKIASKIMGAFSMSADGGKIAFAAEEGGNTDIFVINSDGTGRKRLTINPYSDDSPSISADGDKIAFTSTLNGDYEICVINSDGTNLTQITSGGKNLWSHISGDGTRIVFLSRVSSDFEYGLFVASSNGTELNQITNNTSFMTQVLITNDGKRIIFTDSDAFGYQDGTFTVNSDGTELKQLLPTNPNWLSISADGKKIAFVSNDVTSEIFVGNSTGIGLTPITADLPPVVYTYAPPSIISLFDFTFPSISGDGEKIAFVSGQLFVINSDGTGLTQVTNMEGPVEYPAISADGSKIAFLSKVGDYNYDLYVTTDLQTDFEKMNTPAPTVSPTAAPSVPPSNLEPFPTIIVATASAGVALAISAGLLIYIKKRNH